MLFNLKKLITKGRKIVYIDFKQIWWTGFDSRGRCPALSTNPLFFRLGDKGKALNMVDILNLLRLRSHPMISEVRRLRVQQMQRLDLAHILPHNGQKVILFFIKEI